MIALAIQRGNLVYTYNENNSPLYSINGELVGFTAGTVSIKRDGCIFVYNDKCQNLFYQTIQ